jgi:F-type H+-transporting ATPase subunit delta
MPNPRLANRYAKSLIDLATEQGQLDTIHADMQYLQAVIKASKDFVALLRSPIIKADKKAQILDAVTKDKVSVLTASFNRLLTAKGRESDLPGIVEAVIQQYNAIKGIHMVTLTTAVPVSDELKKAIETKVAKEAGLGTVQLEAKVNDKIIGGFILEFNNNLVDASILRDLRDVKKQFAANVYVSAIR